MAPPRPEHPTLGWVDSAPDESVKRQSLKNVGSVSGWFNQARESQTETRGWSSYFQTMGRLAIAILVASASSQLAAQTPDRTLERISLALERPRSIVGADSGEALRAIERQMLGVTVFQPLAGTPRLGPFEFKRLNFAASSSGWRGPLVSICRTGSADWQPRTDVAKSRPLVGAPRPILESGESAPLSRSSRASGNVSTSQ